MKRSDINKLLAEAVLFFKDMHFKLPPFAGWSPDRWQEEKDACREIFDCMLGWDVTDFGSGDFEKCGLLLFTLRNGCQEHPVYDKPYAEKIMIVKEGQITPFHFHRNKTEDIINRGGGNLLMRLYQSTVDEGFSAEDIRVSLDGKNTVVGAGAVVSLAPGESITLKPGQYHTFWAEKGMGPVLAGEVSAVNDDRTDNRFYLPAGRFPAIVEDEKPLYLMVDDYANFI